MKEIEFNKLKKIDRVEYILRSNLIKENHRYVLFSCLIFIIMTWFMVMTLGLLFYIAFKDTIFLDLLLKMKIFFIIYFVMAIALDIDNYFKKKKKFKELEDRFST